MQQKVIELHAQHRRMDAIQMGRMLDCAPEYVRAVAKRCGFKIARCRRRESQSADGPQRTWPALGVPIPPSLYGGIKVAAYGQNISVAEFMRQAARAAVAAYRQRRAREAAE